MTPTRGCPCNGGNRRKWTTNTEGTTDKSAKPFFVRILRAEVLDYQWWSQEQFQDFLAGKDFNIEDSRARP